MKLHIVLLVILVVFTSSTSTLNILGIFPYQGKSHFFVFRVILKELARRGHNLTVISHFPDDNAPSNYKDISLAGSVKIVEDDLPIERSYLTILGVGIYLTTFGRDNCRIMLANKEVQDLVKKKPKFDVILLEQFNSDCALGIAHKLGAPVVGISSHILMPWHYKRLGIPSDASFVPFHFLEGGTTPTLYQRVERMIFDVYFRTLYYFITQRSDQNALAEHFGEVPPLDDLAREIKFHLLYHNFILTGSRLFPANVIEVGGYHVTEAKPLAGELKKFIDEADNGVIYISFGSVAKASTLTGDKLKALLDVINELPQRFIWKWEGEVQLGRRDKLYLSNWLPQIDILAHPKVLAFLSHAGMGSTTEAIHYGVPVVAIPIVGDQPANADSIRESGLGVIVQIKDWTKENLLDAFKKVLDPKFKENVKDLSKAWHDRPMSPLDTAVYWIEFAARHANLTFRTAAADVPVYKYYNLDIIAIVALVVIVIIAIKRATTTHTPDRRKIEKKNKKRN